MKIIKQILFFPIRVVILIGLGAVLALDWLYEKARGVFRK